MSKYSTKYKSKKNKIRSKINKSKRLKRNKYSRRKNKKVTRKRKRRRNLRGGRPPPYTKKELLDAIHGLDSYMHRALTKDNPSLEKFEKLINLLKYVNWLNTRNEFHDKIEKYNKKTNLGNIVNMLYDSYSEHGTYENALDNIIRDLAGLAMRGVPDGKRQRHNAEEASEEGKVITDFQNPTDIMIDNYFHHLYPHVEDVVYYM